MPEPRGFDCHLETQLPGKDGLYSEAFGAYSFINSLSASEPGKSPSLRVYIG